MTRLLRNLYMRLSCRGFTLVELIIVILVLAIIAAIVVPQFSNASARSRDASAQTTLSYLRGQIDLFKSQHGEIPPQPGALWTLMQRTSGTMETATAAPTGTAVGPYFRANPVNPWNDLTAATAAPIDTTAGWYYTATPSAYTLQLRNPDGTINTQY